MKIPATVKIPNVSIVGALYTSFGTSYSDFAIVQTGPNSFQVISLVKALEDILTEGYEEPNEE